VTGVETVEYRMQMIALNANVAKDKVDVVIAVEKSIVLTSSWRADRYMELLCPTKKRKNKRKKGTPGWRLAWEYVMARAIGARERARPTSAWLQHLRWRDILEVVADGADSDH
jgi:hypothetical protein